MAELSLGESRWRMIRRVLKKKRFGYADCRNQTRHDLVHFDWLLTNGFIARVGADVYQLTDRGRAAADLGLYDLRPTDTVPPKQVSGPRRRLPG